MRLQASRLQYNEAMGQRSGATLRKVMMVLTEVVLQVPFSSLAMIGAGIRSERHRVPRRTRTVVSFDRIVMIRYREQRRGKESIMALREAIPG